MSRGLIAKAETTVEAKPADVWDALVDPASIRQYMFGTNVVSDWQPGSPIVWKGEWQGRPYEDKGRIVHLEPERRLSYTHYSPASGQPDVPENYHTVDIELQEAGGGTRVVLSQDNNATDEERADSQKNWEMMLGGLKKFVEEQGR